MPWTSSVWCCHLLDGHCVRLFSLVCGLLWWRLVLAKVEVTRDLHVMRDMASKWNCWCVFRSCFLLFIERRSVGNASDNGYTKIIEYIPCLFFCKTIWWVDVAGKCFLFASNWPVGVLRPVLLWQIPRHKSCVFAYVIVEEWQLGCAFDVDTTCSFGCCCTWRCATDWAWFHRLS